MFYLTSADEWISRDRRQHNERTEENEAQRAITDSFGDGIVGNIYGGFM